MLLGVVAPYGADESVPGVCASGKTWEGFEAMDRADDIRDFFFGDDDVFEPVAASGNGGTAEASANGGAVAVGDVNSGENSGNAIGVGDTVGGVAVDGGAVANSTTLTIEANGGTAIADASGGDYNVAFLDDLGFLS